ncbi:hypothetical protein [Methanoculleus sp.]|uniref:hypothetical protein n=1 Tax=Methanoculleus sp. TaxID=90427 RepID=UPI0025D17F49|nr:hypothetical protein [Methanoculleus sp.]MCK9320222.1 hypothetical protein [Methanoculleus sp.]
MKKYTEEELKQIFKNRSNCYADSDEVIMAMDEEQFINVLKELKILPIPAVVGQSEQLVCEHEERTMQGNGFTYVICSKCGKDL